MPEKNADSNLEQKIAAAVAALPLQVKVQADSLETPNETIKELTTKHNCHPKSMRNMLASGKILTKNGKPCSAKERYDSLVKYRRAQAQSLKRKNARQVKAIEKLKADLEQQKAELDKREEGARIVAGLNGAIETESVHVALGDGFVAASICPSNCTFNLLFETYINELAC